MSQGRGVSRFTSGEQPCPAGFHLEWCEVLQQYCCKPDRVAHGVYYQDLDFEPFDPDELGLDPEEDGSFY